MNFKKYTIICGHYGTGKTTVSVALACKLAKQGSNVCLVDMDLVNPFYRTDYYIKQLQQNKVKTILPVFSGTTLENAVISGEINSVFISAYDHVIFDIGGDDAGATALGSISEKFLSLDYEMLFIINYYREIIREIDDCIEIMREIELSSHLKVTSVINNSHLSEFTDTKVLENGMDYAKKVSVSSGLPIKFTSVMKGIEPQQQDMIFINKLSEVIYNA